LAAQRVYIIWKNPIFRDSVQVLLRHPGLEWVGSTPSQQTAEEEIPILQPNTILLEQNNAIRNNEIWDLFQGRSDCIRLVEISLEDNQVVLFCRQERDIFQENELLELILNPLCDGG